MISGITWNNIFNKGFIKRKIECIITKGILVKG